MRRARLSRCIGARELEHHLGKHSAGDSFVKQPVFLLIRGAWRPPGVMIGVIVKLLSLYSENRTPVSLGLTQLLCPCLGSIRSELQQ